MIKNKKIFEGLCFINKNGESFVIMEYKNCSSIIIKFFYSNSIIEINTRRLKQLSFLDPHKRCKVCNKTISVGYYCDKHQRQIKKYGTFLDRNPRSRLDRNEIIQYQDHAEMILYNKNHEEIARTLIDLDDVSKIQKYKWHYDKGYVLASINGKTCGLQRFILDFPDNKVVDHKNQNTLDNRKCNLRACTMQENARNHKVFSTNKVGYTGITKINDNAWEARIVVNGKNIYIGKYKTLEEAIKARQEKEFLYFGEFSPFNKGED